MKFVICKRRTLTAVGCLLAAALMFTVVNHPAIVGVAASDRRLPIYCVERDQKMLSISFDAAWGDVRVRRQAPASARQGMDLVEVHHDGKDQDLCR